MKLRDVILLPLCTLLSNVSGDKVCGKKHLNHPKGKIETRIEEPMKHSNCTWLIQTVPKSVVSIKIEYLQLGGYDERYNIEEKNCLNITSPDQIKHYFTSCSGQNYFDALSFPTNELLITLEINSESYLLLLYTSYIVNCSRNELNCYNSRFYPRKISKVCADGMLTCASQCSYGKVNCGDFCYDIRKQRCNGVIDCPTGEDELDCNPHQCPNQIACSDQSKCLQPRQICNQKPDCKNFFDEINCSNFYCKEDDPTCHNNKIERILENYEEPVDLNLVIVTAFVVLLLIFVFLICRCFSKMESRQHALNHPVDIPLPPFQGPGESSSIEDQFQDEDFRPGGDIWQSYTSNLEKIKNVRKNITEVVDDDITIVKPAEGQSVLDKYFNGIKPFLAEDMAALATIKISRESCFGLRKTKSEERPLTRKLFIDNKDNSDNSGIDDYGEDEEYKPPNKEEPLFRVKTTKSDSNYIRRKRVSFNFV